MKIMYHLYTLHQRQTHSAGARQANHTGWGVMSGFQQSDHSLHTLATWSSACTPGY